MINFFKKIENVGVEQKNNSEKLSEKEALAYQDVATKESGRGFSEMADVANYADAEKMIEELRSSNKILEQYSLQIDWDLILEFGQSSEKYKEAVNEIMKAVNKISGNTEKGSLSSIKNLGAALLLLLTLIGPAENSMAASKSFGAREVNGTIVKLNSFSFHAVGERHEWVDNTIASWIKENSNILNDVETIILDQSFYDDKISEIDGKNFADIKSTSSIIVVLKDKSVLVVNGEASEQKEVDSDMKYRASNTGHPFLFLDKKIENQFRSESFLNALKKLKEMLSERGLTIKEL